MEKGKKKNGLQTENKMKIKIYLIEKFFREEKQFCLIMVESILNLEVLE